MRDLAGWYLQALDELDLGPVNVVGLSMAMAGCRNGHHVPPPLQKDGVSEPTGHQTPRGRDL